MSTGVESNVDTIIANTQVTQHIDPLFDAFRTPEPSRHDFHRLAAGTLAAIQVPAHLPMDQCAALVQALNDCEFDAYDERRIYPPVMKLGPAVYDYYLDGGLKPEYWADARHARQVWQRAIGDRPDPLAFLVAELRRFWNGPVLPATVNGMELSVGMIRELTGGARMHFDEVVREFPGGLDQEIVAQFGFNCYVDVPDSGGELVVYRRRWRPRDEQERIGYGWHEQIAADEPRVVIGPGIGDSIWFDSRNYHTIRPNDQGRRLTLSFFCGVTTDNALVLWS